MPENELRALLNRVRWDPASSRGDVSLVVRAREGGAIRDFVIPFADVIEVLPAGLEIRGGTFIPYHRVLVVRRGENILWQVRKGDGDEA